MKRVLLLSGTGEARRIADRLMAAGGFHVVASLAGVTNKPVLIGDEQRSGGFGGSQGLRRFIAEQRIDLLVDATHPFAAQMKMHASEQSLPRLHVIRPPWQQQHGDSWIICETLDDAARLLPGDARAFLALGQRHLDVFLDHAAIRFVRSIEEPVRSDASDAFRYIRGAPGCIDDEVALLRQYRITHLICRNSGGRAGVGKIAAARTLGLPVLMISRPPPPQGELVETPEAAIDWCLRHNNSI